jgi:hypothetical protein
MKVALLKKSLLLQLAVVLLLQTALVSLAESNMWDDRRKAIESHRPGEGQLALATLPSSLPRLQSSVIQQSASTGSLQKKYFSSSQKFQALMDSIPLASASIHEVYDSGQDASSPVLLLQDVHMNAEAQTNIAAVLLELMNQKQVDVVGVEGAFGAFDFSPFRSFPDQNIVKSVTTDFLQKRRVAAPSFAGITSPSEPPSFVGVDDRLSYDLRKK